MEILRSQDPFSFFQNWLAEAAAKEPNDPEAVALATVGADGMPSVRMVLCKQVDAQGFRFFTNAESRKGRELAAHSKAAMCFHWKSLLRQVRIEGTVEKLPQADADAYFRTRHPLSQLGAWASLQSQPLESRAVLEVRVEEMRAKFGEQDIPCPAHWSGYVLVPRAIEFWQQGAGRLHDRFVFTRAGDGWDIVRLNP
ncbi:MAG TPA: pyridoxamine 5'-phosphate oxidase [Alphaproteobacteria bacterium]|nr:pyridoxamine 5'-phosphate oxidase [Alphaproteobacteria bacterium]